MSSASKPPPDHSAYSAPVRMSLSLVQAERISDALVDSRGCAWNRALRDLLWLRVIVIEQLRRTPRLERQQFERRADAILATFWAGATAGIPSGPGHTVGQHDKP